MEGIGNTIIKTGAFFVNAEDVLTLIKKYQFTHLGRLAIHYNAFLKINSSNIRSLYDFDFSNVFTSSNMIFFVPEAKIKNFETMHT